MHELSCQNVLDKVSSFTTVTVQKEMEPYCQHWKTFRETIICKQQHKFTHSNWVCSSRQHQHQDQHLLENSGCKLPQQVFESNSELLVLYKLIAMNYNYCVSP